jgi:hypothetical protein
VRGLSCAAIDCACSSVAPLPREAVIPVARNVWLPIGTMMPAAAARRRGRHSTRLLFIVGGGILVGLACARVAIAIAACARVAIAIADRTSDHLIESTLTTIAAFGSLLAEHLQFSSPRCAPSSAWKKQLQGLRITEATFAPSKIYRDASSGGGSLSSASISRRACSQ